jgi:hypothetical protein
MNSSLVLVNLGLNNFSSLIVDINWPKNWNNSSEQRDDQKQ